ncbi:hypothetical protein FJT64_019236 [Amphibalanus amphitrite]|uniref:Uncharacterized protein n=1 Tax=Amphibalanus amphitrite TaxID=1232801 RepID=A0A6A4X0U0_AMPAM|nr:hypothetical protein FJT64_019236 [Amphibalanus amphitrite]
MWDRARAVRNWDRERHPEPARRPVLRNPDRHGRRLLAGGAGSVSGQPPAGELTDVPAPRTAQAAAPLGGERSLVAMLGCRAA